MRGDQPSINLFSVDSGSPIHEIKGMQPQERPINVSDDGKTILVANANGLSATVYRINVETGDRQLVRTLEMHDRTGSFGITRVMATPDG